VSEHENRMPVQLSSAKFDDPHMQPKAKNPQAVERRIAVLFLLGFGLTAGFGAVYWVAGPSWALGATLGGGMLMMGLGLVAWGKYLMPQGPFVEERHDLSSSGADRDALAATISQRGGNIIQRRKMLGGLLGAGMGTFGIVALFPVLRSLGPNPNLKTTDWKRGTYLVDNTGHRINVKDMSIGSVVTVYPEGLERDDQAQAQDQVIVIRVSDKPFTTMKGRESWTPDGYVAYSKLCTHLACPVGLYEKQLELLVCPCHQSMFNVRNGAVPQFGPAPRPLPQLPLYKDAKGHLRARGGFDQPVGPGFWERK
jgi:ubiquinol-cytochrome c reductase iron-sulfur subunit